MYKGNKAIANAMEVIQGYQLKTIQNFIHYTLYFRRSGILWSVTSVCVFKLLVMEKI